MKSEKLPKSSEVRAMLRDSATASWLRLVHLRNVVEARDLGEVIAAVDTAAAMAAEGLHVVGFLSYESASAFDPSLVTGPPGWLPYAWFAGFARAEPMSVGDGAQAHLDSDLSIQWGAEIDRRAHGDALAEIHHLIGRGDTYQVNYSHRLRTYLDDHCLRELDQLFATLSARQPESLGSYLETADWAILCASHELFFDRRNDRLISRPMKGTVARGVDRQDDEARAAWLAASQKNRAENLMITDMVRNDLGRIAEPGSVRARSLFELEQHPTVWQMTSTVEARASGGLVDCLRALFPAASITGAPKRRAMEIIRDLEHSPRQIYTGTIGYLRPDGSAQFNVAIRTMLVSRTTGAAEYGVGGGIVWDSEPSEEYQECLAKALILDQAQQPFQLLETLRWEPGVGYVRLELHLDRLAEAARHFGYPCNRSSVRTLLEEAIPALPDRARRIRLLLTADGSLEVSDADLGELPASYRLALAPAPTVDPLSPFVRFKTTHRVVYDRARATTCDADDVLLWNSRGEITETTIANVLVELDGQWCTPPVASGLLPGVGRRELLERSEVHERVISLMDLERASRIRLVNSLRGVWDATLLGLPST